MTLVVVGMSAATVDGQAANPPVVVSVDLSATRQVIDGFGSSERVWADPHLTGGLGITVPAKAQAQILSALYGRLGLTRVRNVLDPGVQRAPGAPFTFSGKLADLHIAFVKQAKRYGLRTFFPGPVYLEDWMTPDDPESYVEWAMAMLRHWRARGLEPPLYAPLNEPEIARDFPPAWMHDVVLALGTRLRKEGFRTKLVVPDDENPVDAYTRSVAVLQDPKARQYVAALAFHIYKGDATDWPRMRELAVRYRLPLWMTEYSTAAYARWPDALDWAVKIHGLLTIGGVSAIDYLFAFFGNSPDAPISIAFRDGRYAGFSYKPAYWITGQYSRFVRPGFRRLEARPAEQGDVLTTAFKGDGRVVVVAVNKGDSDVPLRLVLKGGVVRPSVAVTRSSARENWKALGGRTLVRSSFTATLPRQSVTTFLLRLAG